MTHVAVTTANKGARPVVYGVAVEDCLRRPDPWHNAHTAEPPHARHGDSTRHHNRLRMVRLKPVPRHFVHWPPPWQNGHRCSSALVA